MIMATDVHTTVAEPCFSVQSAMVVLSLCNRRNKKRYFLWGVCPEAISGELKPMAV
jgi:hypothetical protein